LRIENRQVLDVRPTEDDELVELLRRGDLGALLLAAFRAEHADVAEGHSVLLGVNGVQEPLVADLALADEADAAALEAADAATLEHWSQESKGEKKRHFVQQENLALFSPNWIYSS